MSILLALLFVMLAGGAVLNMLFDVGSEQTPMKVLGNGLGGTRFARMSEH